MAILQRLPQHFEHVTVELGKFIQKEHTAMRQTDLARHRMCPAAQQPGIGNRMVR